MAQVGNEFEVFLFPDQIYSAEGPDHFSGTTGFALTIHYTPHPEAGFRFPVESSRSVVNSLLRVIELSTFGRGGDVRRRYPTERLGVFTHKFQAGMGGNIYSAFDTRSRDGQFSGQFKSLHPRHGEQENEGELMNK